MENKLVIPASGIVLKQWTTGLSSYTQSNCSCTLTDNGYRIYRAPNLTVSSNGRTMWGGLIINPFSISSTIIKPNHKYIIKFHISGQSSNVAEMYLSYSAGWPTGGGLGYGGNNIVSLSNPSEFKGEQDCYFQFDVGSSLYQTATVANSGYTVGNNYNVYNQFKFGFTYTSTGSLGTDLYITDLRMYDITNVGNTEIKKIGILETGSLEEIDGHFRMGKDYETDANYFYEI